MEVTDNTQCDIWYQALLERASDYTGVFFCRGKNYRCFLYFCLSGTKTEA